jgi:hypothetical protein
MTASGYIEPAPGRGPDDPTEYELAAARLSPKELRKWVRAHYRTRYIPDEALKAAGVDGNWL